MAQPRFMFVAGDANRPGWTFWLNEAAGAAAAGRDRSWVAWRLTAANNRELGRSATTFADLANCREAAATLQREIDRAEATTLNEETGLWGWRLDLDGAAVAASARLYLRQRESQYNLAQFLAAVPAALITERVLALIRDSHDAENGCALAGA